MYVNTPTPLHSAAGVACPTSVAAAPPAELPVLPRLLLLLPPPSLPLNPSPAAAAASASPARGLLVTATTVAAPPPLPLPVPAAAPAGCRLANAPAAKRYSLLPAPIAPAAAEVGVAALVWEAGSVAPSALAPAVLKMSSSSVILASFWSARRMRRMSCSSSPAVRSRQQVAVKVSNGELLIQCRGLKTFWTCGG
jgi:hypothetical protein